MKKTITALLAVLMLASSVCLFSASAAADLPIVGDVNGDGTVNSSDLLLIKRCILSLASIEEDSVADINGDSEINASDLLLLKRSVLEVVNLDTTMNGKLGMNKQKIGDKLTSIITGDKYSLVMIDDFKGTSLNTSNWSYFTKNYNGAEQQVNRKENISVENGNLVITGKKETQQYTGDAESWETPKTSYFTGGAINSQGKKTYQYGKLEIRCKIPYSYGMWPAFWTQGTQRGWPWGGEIDIMEFVGGVDQWKNYRDDEYNSGLHWSDPTTPSSQAWGTTVGVKATDPDSVWNRTDAHLSTGGKFEIPNGPSQGVKLNDEWRVCGLEWNQQKMYFYCDDKVYLTIDITKTSMREAFHQNHYMILNLAMGGSWAGTPDEAKGTVWPQKFMIDWVKVWQK